MTLYYVVFIHVCCVFYVGIRLMLWGSMQLPIARTMDDVIRLNAFEFYV